MSTRAVSLRPVLRGLLSFGLATALWGCSEDGDSNEASTSADASSTDADMSSSGAAGSSTTNVSTSGASSSTTDASSGEADSSGSETTGPAIGCTPGDPCCNDAGEYAECFLDADNGLAWELVPMGGNPNVADAVAYCDSLTLLGAGGWRLPTVDELRSLMRGCPDTVADGACELSEACATVECDSDACDGCIDAPGGGPAAGCYWDPNLQGECSGYWSATTPGGGFGWIVDFADGSIRQRDAALPAGLVRCVASLQ
ncbi:MAG: DUF1566 domain-containing protein [Nannocystaceae bacterium]|nr:DUF1566 domain-containing protein [bacterium]